ncbi:MAG: response regulator transcription factor [Ignavibacteriaceae bacterium]|jgi:DNA-binding NarL/FixJ family response regulator
MIKDQNKISIVIADDHPMFRSGVKSELEKESTFNILAETGDGKEAMEMISMLKPDIAVLDVKMPGLTGIEIASQLRDSVSKTKIIFLTMYDEKSVFLKAVNEGVSGYLLKDDAIADVIIAVKEVASGKKFISKNLVGILLDKVKTFSTNENLKLPISQLTTVEKKLLLLISDLKTNDELADLLFISKRTIENYKVNLARKLELNSARDLLKFSVKYKQLLIKG